MDKPDWQIPPRIKTDGISLLLPGVQKIGRWPSRCRSGSAREPRPTRRLAADAKTMPAMSRTCMSTRR
jgi:hypothetical protein